MVQPLRNHDLECSSPAQGGGMGCATVTVRLAGGRRPAARAGGQADSFCRQGRRPCAPCHNVFRPEPWTLEEITARDPWRPPCPFECKVALCSRLALIANVSVEQTGLKSRTFGVLWWRDWRQDSPFLPAFPLPPLKIFLAAFRESSLAPPPLTSQPARPANSLARQPPLLLLLPLTSAALQRSGTAETCPAAPGVWPRPHTSGVVTMHQPPPAP